MLNLDEEIEFLFGYLDSSTKATPNTEKLAEYFRDSLETEKIAIKIWRYFKIVYLCNV